jgi:hypothetical protein
MLSLARSKVGLEEVKSFGDNIFIFKAPITKKQDIYEATLRASNNQPSIINNQTAQPASQQFSPPKEDLPSGGNSTILELPITSWANDFDYYKDGWSRGRYAFWRKELFADLKQDFIYTDKQDSALTGKIDQTGNYELWARYLTGGSPGEVEYRIGNIEYRIKKDAGEEKFVWKDLGAVNVSQGDQLSIKNLDGENAIADLVLVSK